MSGCAVILLLPLALIATGLSVAFGGLAWCAAVPLWALWAQAVWASVRDYRRAQAMALRPEPLPCRLPLTVAEHGALDGQADLRAAVWSTPAKEEAL